MRTPMVGTQNITTMGWTLGKTRVYALLPITLAALVTFATIAYALYHAHVSENGEKRRDVASMENVPHDSRSGCLVVPRTAIARFDPSDPIHLIVASAARQLVPEQQNGHGGRHLERYEDVAVFFQSDR